MFHTYFFFVYNQNEQINEKSLILIFKKNESIE